jgi:branched-chain amino acid transport system ATP-binding protein
LAPTVVQNLLEVVRTAATGRGVGVLLDEQHVRLAPGIADRVCVMERGRVVPSGTRQEMARELDAIEAAHLSGREPSSTSIGVGR